MARITFIFFLFAVACSSPKQENKTNNLPTQAVKEEPKNDNGLFPDLKIIKENLHMKLKAGEQASLKVQFQNVGKAPLVLKNISSTCTCTVAEFTKEPVAPNEKGTITVDFDSKGKQTNKVHIQPLVITANTQYKFEKLEVSFEIVE